MNKLAAFTVLSCLLTTPALAGDKITHGQFRAVNVHANSSVKGFWLTDDRDAVVEVTNCEPKSPLLCGFIRGLPGAARNREMAKYAMELCGLPILSKLKFQKGQNRWSGGQIFDLETQRSYGAFIQADGNKLHVRAYQGKRSNGISMQWTRTRSANVGCSPASRRTR